MKTRKICEACSEPTTENGRFCPNCTSACHLVQGTVSAMMKLHGVPAASGICIDCGARPAKHRDHRHYASPLKVDYVCGPCNQRRGAALDLHALIRMHRGLDSMPVETNETPATVSPEKNMSLPLIMQQIEQQHILIALEKTGNNRTKAAALLGITFRGLRYRIERLGIEI